MCGFIPWSVEQIDVPASLAGFLASLWRFPQLPSSKHFPDFHLQDIQQANYLPGIIDPLNYFGAS